MGKPAPKISFQHVNNALMTGIDIHNREIYLLGEIDDETVYKFVVAFRVLDSSPGDIKVIMSSIGGGESQGYAIYDTIRVARNRTIVEGYGATQSIAALILQAGVVRRLSPECRFMVHNGNIDLSEGLDTDTLIAIGNEAARNNARYHEILARRSNLPIETVRKYCADETYFSAQEAVKVGWADEVIRVPVRKRKKTKKRKNGKR